MGVNYLASLSFFIPELLVCFTMVTLILMEAFAKQDKETSLLRSLTVFLGLGSALTFLVINLLDAKSEVIFTNSFIVDSTSTFIKIVMVFGTFAAVYLGKESKDIYWNLKGEFAILAIGVLCGGMLLASANNMLIMYIGIETLSILSYSLASLKKKDDRSSEAGIKYALYGGISAGLMLFGMSHIFGMLGTISFPEIAVKMGELSTNEALLLIPVLILFFAGIAYKISAVPFHMWAPDVYEGSPIPVTAFFSIVPKVAGIAILLRISHTFFVSHGILNAAWVGLLGCISVLTMTVGNISAINQQSVKRMLAYSSISHAGMMMMGILTIDEIGSAAVLFYMITYLFMTLAAFYIVSFVQDQTGNDHFERFSGLFYRYPLIATILAVTMFSLAGVPPLSGFVAKFHIFSALIGKEFYTLAIIAGMNSVIGLYYYLKIVRLMAFKPAASSDNIAGLGVMNRTFITGLGIPVIILGIFWSKVMSVAVHTNIFIR